MEYDREWDSNRTRGRNAFLLPASKNLEHFVQSREMKALT
jgi:hypothetical protein